MNGVSEEIHYSVPYSDLYEIILDVHIVTGRGGRNRIVYTVKSKYLKKDNIEAINIYLKLRKPCQKNTVCVKKV